MSGGVVIGSKLHNDRGAVAIVVAVFFLVGMLLLAFVVDRGLIYVQRAQLQNAVDAAALAAVQDTCSTSPNNEAAARTTATQYLQDNGVSLAPISTNGVTRNPYQIIVQDGPDDQTTGVSVAAEASVTSIFGNLAGVSEATVAARATATRTCTETYQYVASTIFDISGTGAGRCKNGDPAPCPGTDPGINGRIYAGQCFEGNGGKFNSVAVSSNNNATDGAACNSSWKSPIHNGSIRDADVCDNVDSIGSCEFGVPLVLLSDAIEAAGYDIPGFYDPGLAATTLDCKDVKNATFFNARLFCVGDLNVPANVTINFDVAATGNVTTNGDTQFSPTNKILLYSKTAQVTLNNEIVPVNTTVYGPATLTTPQGDPKSSVVYNGSGAGLLGTFIGYALQVNGGGASGGQGVSLRNPGNWTLSQ